MTQNPNNPQNQNQDDDKNKRYESEWSFSFEKLGQNISEFFNSLGQGSSESVKTGQFSELVAGATSARVRIEPSIGKTTITALEASENLIEADVTYIGEIKFVTGGEAGGEKSVALGQAAGVADWVRGAVGWIGSNQQLKWDVALSPQIPMLLDIHSGAGQNQFDLSKLQLTSLSVVGGAGETNLTMPGNRQYAVQINTGVGRASVNIQENATVDLTMRIGTGEVNMAIGNNASINARLTGGIGVTNVIIPSDAAVRVEANAGIGSINVNSRIPRLQTTGESWSRGGVWQTADYETAERKIFLHLEGGVGEFNVR
ncbi:MAG: hypothetical protein GYB67_05185 [Chloroflexi bacterium]|nr:hypothetical protein [Chloroflexota bacterium]